MDKKKEEMLEKLRKVKQTAEIDLQEKPGYENYEVRTVKYYGKVELINKRTGEKEGFDLHVIEVADKNIGEIEPIYYFNGKEIDFAELLRDYESPGPIKDVVDRAEKNKEKSEKEQDKDLKIEDNTLQDLNNTLVDVSDKLVNDIDQAENYIDTNKDTLIKKNKQDLMDYLDNDIDKKLINDNDFENTLDQIEDKLNINLDKQ